MMVFISNRKLHVSVYSVQHQVLTTFLLKELCIICIITYITLIARNSIIAQMILTGHVARMGEERGVYRFLLGKPEGKRPLGRPRCKWVDNIRTDLQEVGCGYVDWIGLAQDRHSWRTLVSALMNIRVP